MLAQFIVLTPCAVVVLGALGTTLTYVSIISQEKNNVLTFLHSSSSLRLVHDCYQR